MSKYDFRGACAVVSGASSGLGFEISKILCREYGCTVIGLARNKKKLSGAALAIGNNFIPCPCDITKAEDRAQLMQKIKNVGFKPDILINNAGMLPPFSAFTPERLPELERVMELNFFAHVRMCAEFLPLLLESTRGAIINVSSSASLATLPGTAAYSASKSALRSFTEALALEYGERLYITCVCPGMTATELFSSHKEGELIARIAAPADKTAKKIVRRACRKHKKIVTGADAHLMSAGNRIFGTAALKTFAAFMKSLKSDIFSESFYKNEENK
ncbi:MAG: SDR family NAD(P)-dependent oxidoreductase [Eubacteriales bacterium]